MVKVEPALPCGYCCGPVPCGSTSPDHDDMGCVDCAAIPLSEPHPECLASVEEYMKEHANDEPF